MIKNWKRAALIAALVIALPLTQADSCDTHSDADSGKVDHAPADVIQFPDGFRNVAHKCDGPNMVYSLSSGQSDTRPGGLAVVPNDPRCAK